MTSAMRAAMVDQPEALLRMLGDRSRISTLASRLAGRRTFLIGTGTSWHAANQGAWLLRRAGLEAWPVQAATAATDGPFPGPGDALVLLTHRGTKQRTNDVLARARASEVPTVVISRVGNPDADLDTVENERSSAFTASHTGALLRVAQLARELGADLEGLDEVPALVAAELAAGPTGVRPPRRLLEFAGAGVNAWTAAEGALKTRESSYVATEGGGCEQCLHGPCVALRETDTLICLDGGGAESARLADLAAAAGAAGATVHPVVRSDSGETASIFVLTVVVQKIAAELAEALGTNPDSFGRDLPGRAAAWDRIEL